MLDPRLKTLQAVARHGTVTAAASELMYTPSTVSYQLRQLSESLGVALLESSGRGVKLTAAAHVVLRHAAIVQAQWERARSEIATVSGEQSGRFVLCGFSTASTQLLPHAAAELGNRHPLLDVHVVQAEPAACFALLESGEADLALVMVTAESPSLEDPRFDQQPLVDDPLDLVVPADHPLTTRTHVTLADAAAEHWVTSTHGTAYHQLTVAACVAAGFKPILDHQADEWETGAAIVSQHLAVMLAPRLGRLSSEWPVARIRLSGEPVPARPIIAATRRGALDHPLVAETLHLVKERCATLYADESDTHLRPSTDTDPDAASP